MLRELGIIVFGADASQTAYLRGNRSMLSYEDCVGLSELTEEEIRAISEHEHIPEVVAAVVVCINAHQGENKDRQQEVQ